MGSSDFGDTFNPIWRGGGVTAAEFQKAERQ